LVLPTRRRLTVRLLRDEDGPTAVAHPVIPAVIIVVCIAAIGMLGTDANAARALRGEPMPERPAADRRALVRAPCAPGSQARAGEFYEGCPGWGRMLDASPAGLGLLLREPFRRGALVVVTLRRPGAGKPYSTLARVAHATACPDGNYRVGCALNFPLPADVLHMLTAGPAGPPGSAAALVAVRPT
jgi:Flp pilus assembly pilin Flp